MYACVQVLEQIHSAGGDTAAVVLVLTDGEFRDLDLSLTQVNGKPYLCTLLVTSSFVVQICNQTLAQQGVCVRVDAYVTLAIDLQANRLRKRGARVFGIGIGEDVDEQQVLKEKVILEVEHF